MATGVGIVAIYLFNFSPFLSDGQDFIEVVTGKNFVTKEDLSSLEYTATVGGFLVPGFLSGSVVRRVATNIVDTTSGIVESITRAFAKRSDVADAALDKSIKTVDNAADANQIAGYLPAPKEVIDAAVVRIGHATPWEQMTDSERRRFQHSYDRHKADLGLENFRAKDAAALQKRFNQYVGYIREHGTEIVGKRMFGPNGQKVDVRYWEFTWNGVKYYYYETLDGIFISAGKSS